MKRSALFLSVGAAVMLLASVAMAQPPKIDICHIPQGNPDNVQLISVSKKSATAHDAHGDFLAGCFGCDGDCCDLEECVVLDDGSPGCETPDGQVFPDPCPPPILD